MPEAENQNLPAGWGFPTLAARKAHYFPEAEVRSLCGRYGRFVPIRIEPDESPSPDDCATCRKRLEGSR